ncbi:MAG: phosphotransferase [Henriciella sp.]|nr:phosphotransferase [Henriciella sp.]
MSSDLDRTALIDQFLADAGWGDAAIGWLGQDASTRRYARLARAGGETAILMDAPLIEDDPCTPDMTEAERQKLGWNAMTRLASSRVDAFVLIAQHLRAAGLRPPEILAHDSTHGFALLEDFGDQREFARLIEGGAAEVPLYTQAARDLAKLHRHPKPDILEHQGERWPILPFDDVALRANADLYADWLHQYDDRARMTDADRARWEAARDGLIEQAMGFEREFTLRDYHAENLLWLPEDRIGLLDFQDAVIGWDAWDLAMLTQDSRREVSAAATEAVLRTYLEESGKEESALMKRLAVIGTLNALRIAGVFARLVKRDGKPRYNDFMPRQQLMLARNLKHPAAADMRIFIADTAPFILEAET